MIDVREEKLLAKHAAKLKQLFGPPPVLSSEDPGRFDQLLADLMACFTPADFLEQYPVRLLAVSWANTAGQANQPEERWIYLPCSVLDHDTSAFITATLL